MTDGECNVIDVNEVHSRITGLSEEVFRGNNMRDLVNKKVLSVSSSVEVAKKGEEVTLHQMVSNGRHYDVKAFPIKDKENNDCIEYIVSFLLDVSDIIKTKEIANRLKQNVLEMEEKYKKLLTSVGEKDSESIIYKSKKMQDLVDRAKKCSENDVPVLITGPSGSGKEMIASLIHRESGRKNEKFIKINCAAIPENLLESELFGYEKGAFTGALKDGKRGILEECGGGTILLDEIGEMSLSVQAKLLRVLQENKIRRIGSSEEKEVDVRILAATNVNLKEKIKQKSFRADLYYRLNVIELKVPGLKERIEDIPLLIYYFMQIFNEKYKKDKKLDRESVKYLCGIEYPGNVRELKNTVERLIIQSDDKNISLEEVLDIMDVDETHYYKGSRVDLDLYKGKGLKEIMADYEKNVLKEFFMEYRNSSQVAKRLKVDRTTISRKRKEYNI